MRPIAHFITVTKHRWLVRKYCFRLGLYWQGLVHDLSKYSSEEFWQGARYYQGTASPNFTERRQNGLGYSRAWLHHKGRNKHHFDYWQDYCLQEDGSLQYQACRMPMKYLAEMFCDRLAANKNYHGKNYTDDEPYAFFMKTKDQLPMHPESGAEMEKMLLVLKDQGEGPAFAYVKKRLREEKNKAPLSGGRFS